MKGRVPPFAGDALEALESLVSLALTSADAPQPEVLGYGEISSVLASRFDGRGVAAKRLPPFPSGDAFEAFRACFVRQLETYDTHGIPVLATELRRVEGAESQIIAYCVQPLLDGSALVPAQVKALPDSGGTGLIATILDLALAYVAPTRGFDAQLANWALFDGELVYLDVTTPFLRDEAGRECLDTDLLVASLPWALRGLVRRFMVRGILDPYYTPRGVVLDLLGNLIKEGLGECLPELVPLAARKLGEPVSIDEVQRYYAADARTWRLLQRLRRLDRAWQWHVRRRPYPFLLPGPVERHV